MVVLINVKMKKVLYMKFLIIVLMTPYFERNLTNINSEPTIEKNLNMRFFKYGKDEPIILEVNNKISGKELKEQYRKE